MYLRILPKELWLLSFSLFLLINISCSKENGQNASIAGTYQGTAMINEQLYIDYELVFDTMLETSDVLLIEEVNSTQREYNFILTTDYRTYYGQKPFAPEINVVDESNRVWIGLDEYGYTYDFKKDWAFDPTQDTAYFRLIQSPYDVTLVDDPDSIGHYTAVLHKWEYVLRAERQ